MKKTFAVLLFSGLFSLIAPAQAYDYAYYGFEPQIVTNYVATQKKLGFVRLTVELMVDAKDLEAVEHHSPLLRDAIITIIGQQPQSQIKSIKGRGEIRKLCEIKVKNLLQKETGQELVKKLLFTQWLDD